MLMCFEKQNSSKHLGLLLSVLSGICRSTSAKPMAKRKKRTCPGHLKTRRNCTKTMDYSISHYIVKIQSYINGFTGS